MTTKSKNIQEGKDFLIIPTGLAPVANVIGLYAIAYYKVQQLIKKAVIDYCELVERLEQTQHDYEEFGENDTPALQRKKLSLEKNLATLTEQRKLHVAHAYPGLIKQIYGQRREAQRRAATAAQRQK